jgi:hypothetical protein
VNAGDKRGGTSLRVAADIVQLLLGKGADAHAETPDGATALAAAVSGVPDIDSFTVEKCHDAVAALLGKAPDSRLKDDFHGLVACLAANASGCAAVVAFVAHTQAVQRPARGPV